MQQYLWLLPLGVLVGAFGTLIGAGGGFILMPVLILLYPEQSPVAMTAISLVVVFLNAASGTAAYARMRRIDYKSGLMFSLATVPGAVLGAMATALFPRRWFDLVFGLLLMGVSAYLLTSTRPPSGHPRTTGGRRFHRAIVEADGTRHEWSFNPAVGLGLSLLVGFVSSLLGIGGGIIHVPAMVRLLSFPVHIATATSQFVLAIMALAGTGVHVLDGALLNTAGLVIPLAIGVVIGAQFGAWLSNRVRGRLILVILALALGSVGLRILVAALSAR
jgi:hypothetical protein